MGNRPPLTGVRAFLLVSILVYHSNFSTFPGAWVSMSVFFALSGFLITAMLCADRERHGRIGLKNFYSRRAVRLLPPLVLTVGLLAVYAALVYVPDARDRVWGDGAAALFYFADYRFALGHEPLFGYLAQAWSLSVEEQYYVVWSVLMLVSVGMGRRRIAYAMAIGGIAFAFADRLWILHLHPHFTTAVFNRIYYAFDTRADALFVGCLLGLIATGQHLQGWSPRARAATAAVALAAAALMVWIGFTQPLGTRDLLLWWLPLSEVASVAIILYFIVQPNGLGSRLVGRKPFVLVGNMTYTVYLVHWPVYIALAVTVTHLSYWPNEALRLVVIFGIAAFSWYCIEQPLMRWRRRALN